MENAIRVALVIFIADNWTEEVTQGTTHGMLGMGVFVLIFALSLSTDRALGVFVSRQRTTESFDKNIPVTHAPDNSHRPFLPAFFSYGLIALFVIVGVLGVRLSYVKKAGIGRFRADNYVMTVCEKSDIPEEYQGWKQSDFNYKINDHDNIFGDESYSWIYEKDGQTIIVSVDGLYHEFHNLAFCYSQTGWSTRFEHQYQRDIDSLATSNLLTDTEKQSESSVNYTKIVMNQSQSHGLCFV